MADDNGLFGGLESVFGGLANTVAEVNGSLVKAAKENEADANARRLFELSKNPRLSPDAILQTLRQLNNLYQRTELPQELRDRVYGMMGKAVEKPRLSELFGKKREEALKMMKDARMPEEIIAKLQQQTFGRTSSSSERSSASGPSIDGGTQGSEKSQTSTVEVIKQLGKKPDNNQGSLDSPPSLLPSEYQDSEESKKAPTQSPGCSAGIKKAFLSCYSLLSNGLSNFTKLFSKAPESKGYSQVPEGTREAQAPRQRREESKESRESIFASFRNGVSEFMSKNREMDIHKVRFDARHGFSSQYSSTVGLGSLNNAGKAVIGGVGKAGKGSFKGVKTFAEGMVEVGATGYSGAKFMTTGWSGRNKESWGDWVNGLRASTRGMQGPTVRESEKAAKVAGVFVGAAVREVPGAIKAITPGPRAARFAADAAKAGLGAGASFVNMVGNAKLSALVPRNIR